jgi:hypothetical protein
LEGKGREAERRHGGIEGNGRREKREGRRKQEESRREKGEGRREKGEGKWEVVGHGRERCIPGIQGNSPRGGSSTSGKGQTAYGPGHRIQYHLVISFRNKNSIFGQSNVLWKVGM